MKSIKGLALGAALAGVVFTGAANADAATIGKDVAGTKYEEATTKLAALGITKGYPDGTVRPDENVTRAQTAAFMIRALNYQLAMDQSTTIFSDVAYEHPLSGAVQLASGKGIIKGYLDGTFRAEESVTIAQASAILVRMLGYGPAINEADFPNSHLSKAAELGILKNVKADVNAPAKRGDIMLMVSNALTVDLMKQTEWGNDHKWEEKKDENLLTEFFDLTVVETRKDFKEEYGEQKNYEGDLPRVRDTARTKIGSLKANELEFEGIGGTYTINEMFNATDFLAQEVQVWIDEDEDHVVYIADSKDQKVVVDLADKWDNTEMTKLKLDNGDKYDVRKDAKIIYNLEKEVEFSKLSDTEKKALTDGTVLLKVVLDSNEDVIGLVATNISESDRGLVEEANASKKIIDFMDGSATASQLKLDGKDFFVVRDGAIATLDDLEKEDVVNYFKKKNEDKYYILATSTKVSGKVENVKTTDLEEVSKYDLFIDGKKYDVAAGATYSDNKNEDIDDVDTDDLDEMDGVDATLYLNAAGDVQHIVTGELDSTVGNVAVVTKSVKWLTQDEEWELTIVNEFGKEVKYRFENDDIDVDGKERTDKYIFDNLTIKNDSKGKQGQPAFNNNYVFIEYSVNKDGDLKSIDILRTQTQIDAQKTINGWSETEIKKLESKYLLVEADTRGDVKLDKYDENVKIKGNSYKVTRNSVFFDVTKDWTNEYKDVDTVKWDNIKDKENDIVTAFVKVKSNDRDLEYMFVTDSDKNLTSKGEYGFITGFKKVGRDDAVTITRIDGEKLTIVMDDKSYDTIGSNYLKDGSTDLWTKGAFIRYELNSDDEIDGMQIIATAGTKKGFYTAPISDSNKGEYSALSIDNVAVGVVEKSTTSSISLSKLDGKASTSGNVVVNSNTVYVDLVDDGEMDIVGGVNRGDFVIAIDSDDDGNAADFVIIIGEDYKDVAGDSDKDEDKVVDAGKVTYIDATDGVIAVDNETYAIDVKTKLLAEDGSIITVGKGNLDPLLNGEKVKDIVVKDGVVESLTIVYDAANLTVANVTGHVAGSDINVQIKATETINGKEYVDVDYNKTVSVVLSGGVTLTKDVKFVKGIGTITIPAADAPTTVGTSAAIAVNGDSLTAGSFTIATVASSAADMTLSHPGAVQYVKANLAITGLKDAESNNIEDGNYVVKVVSDKDGEVFNAKKAVATGSVTGGVDVVLKTVGTHTLTVTVDGFTKTTTAVITADTTAPAIGTGGIDAATLNTGKIAISKTDDANKIFEAESGVKSVVITIAGVNYTGTVKADGSEVTFTGLPTVSAGTPYTIVITDNAGKTATLAETVK